MIKSLNIVPPRPELQAVHQLGGAAGHPGVLSAVLHQELFRHAVCTSGKVNWGEGNGKGKREVKMSGRK